MGGAIERDIIHRRIQYTPLPTQARFHRSTARFKGYSGPVGSGKSQALCQEAIKLSYLNPGRTGLLGAPTYPMLRDATLPALIEVLESNGLPYEHRKTEGVLVMADTGSKILLRSLEEYERLRGTNLAWFGVDEITYARPEAWDRLEARLRDPKASRLCGYGVWTPKGRDWVYRKFVEQPRKDFALFRAEPFENRYLLSAVPDFYEQLKHSYSDAFYRQEVLGEYLVACGNRVYPAFSRTEHVKSLTADPHKPLLWALDFNVDPMCSIVAQRHGDDVRVLDEIVLRRASTRAACEEFYRRFGGQAGSVVVYGDATGRRMQTSGTTDYEIVQDYFRTKRHFQLRIRVPEANPPVRDRVELVNSRLKSADGMIHMLIDPKCTGLIEDLEQVHYIEDSSEIDKSTNKALTHLSDALGYLLWEEFGSVRPPFLGAHRLL